MQLNHSETVQAWNRIARQDYSFYCMYVHRGFYTPARHTKLICDHLQDVEAGKVDRLIISLPPRHSKSMTVSETFPSFFIGRNPNRMVIEVSYGDVLAEKFGARNKEKIEQFGQQIFGISLNPEKASKKNWELKGHRGGMISAGLGAGITGEGADLLVVDDPIKNRQEADSEAYREMVWSEWQNTLLTRLQPGGRVIVICTRWHFDDLIGRLLATEPEKWTVLSLPAEAETDDPLGRAVGEPLWPEFGFDARWMEEKKKEVGTRVWTSLYQGRPVPEGGGLFRRNWFKYWDKNTLPLRMDQYIMSWDLSFKGNETNDFVCGQVWGRHGADKYLLDMVHRRMDFPETIKAFQYLVNKWPQVRQKLVEDAANGAALISSLKHQISGITPVKPEGGKISRANAVAPDCESGNVYLPADAPWLEDFLLEACSFPAGAHDDMVDAMTQALTNLIGRTYSPPIAAAKYTLGGVYSIGELKLNGLTDTEIRRAVRKGEIRLTGDRQYAQAQRKRQVY